jgi:DNA-binding MarR family transcriptional regulator
MMRRDTLAFQALTSLARLRGGIDDKRCHLVFELLCAGDAIHAAIQRQLAAKGLNELRLNVLSVLFVNDPAPITPADLAYHANVTRSAMTDAIDSLEKHGLVVRNRDKRDRRMIDICLTEEGSRTVDSTLEGYLHLLGKLASDVEIAEQPALIALLRKLQAGTAALLSANS